MKKFLVASLVLFSLIFTGCMNVDIQSPSNKTVTLGRLNDNQKINPTKEKTVYYALWGLVPVSNNSTAEMLEDVKENEKVVIETRTTAKDYIISLFGSFVSVSAQTVSVEVQE